MPYPEDTQAQFPFNTETRTDVAGSGDASCVDTGDEQQEEPVQQETPLRERLLSLLAGSPIADIAPPCCRHIVIDSRLQIYAAFAALSQFGCPSILCSNEAPLVTETHQKGGPQGRDEAGQVNCCSSRGVWVYSELGRKFLCRMDSTEFAALLLYWQRWLRSRRKQQRLQSRTPDPPQLETPSSEAPEAPNDGIADKESKPPWQLSLEDWKDISGAAASTSLRVKADCDCATALLQLLESRMPYICVLNEERRAPLALVSAHGFLVHLVSELRGPAPFLDYAVKDLKIGTFSKIVSCSIENSAEVFLEVMVDSGFSSIPVVSKILQSGGNLNLTNPIAVYWKEFQRLELQHRTLASAGAAMAASSGIPLLGCSQDSTIHAMQQGDNYTSRGSTNVNQQYSALSPDDAAHLTLRDLIFHLLFSNEKKLIILDSRGSVRGIITALDVWRFLIPDQKHEEDGSAKREQMSA